MKEFTEKHHAFIAATFYALMTERYGQRGEEAFILATNRYAEQRGNRMAQRAIRDGQELTYATYSRYGEWVNSDEVKEQGLANKVDVVSISPDYEMHIHSCPWHSQFKKMGLPEAGLAYCRDLDASICRGFNPEMVYEVPQTLHDHDYCIQTVRNSGLSGTEKLEKKPDGIKSFEYHCAHSYWSYSEIVSAIFGAEGRRVCSQVLKEFSEEYGQQMADALKSWENTNFNCVESMD